MYIQPLQSSAKSRVSKYNVNGINASSDWLIGNSESEIRYSGGTDLGLNPYIERTAVRGGREFITFILSFWPQPCKIVEIVLKDELNVLFNE